MNKLIIDVDTGVDDAQAIMVALAAPNVKILGITCCHGNTSLENSSKNTLRVLKVCNRLDIDVYAGCSVPMLLHSINASQYHGTDGLGDAPDPEAPNLDLLKKTKAAEALVKLIQENPGEVTLVATGPLTNLAVAVLLEPSLPKSLKALYIMGGNTESRGNTTVCGEFNFVADPEAAYIVLKHYTCTTFITTWEFTCRNSLPWSFCDEWFKADTEKAKFMKKISKHSMEVARNPDYQKEEAVNENGFNCCDVYAMAAAIDNLFILEMDEVAVTVELKGTYTRGMMVVDHIGHLDKQKAFILKKVDLERLKQLLINSLK